MDNIVRNPHAAGDGHPGEDYQKVIFSEKPDRTYVKGTIVRSATGEFQYSGTFKTSSGAFKDAAQLTDAEKEELKADFEKERKDLHTAYRLPEGGRGAPGAPGCDQDSDSDAVTNKTDVCPSIFDPGQEDLDCDGVGDACDACPGVYDPAQADCNANGVADACEAPATDHLFEVALSPLAIPDDDPSGVSSTIHVPDVAPSNGTVVDLDVLLRIDHPRQSDLVVRLEHDGRQVTLIYRPGTSQPLAGCGPGARGYAAADFGSGTAYLVLDDCARTSIDCYDGVGTGQPGYMGPAHSSRLLAAFAGMKMSGDWTLTVADEATGEVGTVRDWDLRARTLENVPATSAFGQTIVAADKKQLSWVKRADVDFVRGDLAGVKDYSVVGSGSLLGATSLDLTVDTPTPGGGFYYVVRTSGVCGSWQTSIGAEPRRDAWLP